MTGDKTDVTALVKYAQSLEAENARLREALQWIADQVDNEDGDLDDIILCANKALAHEQGGQDGRD